MVNSENQTATKYDNPDPILCGGVVVKSELESHPGENFAKNVFLSPFLGHFIGKSGFHHKSPNFALF